MNKPEKTIDTSLIPAFELDSLSRSIISDCKKLWDDPAERKKYEDWKQKHGG